MVWAALSTSQTHYFELTTTFVQFNKDEFLLLFKTHDVQFSVWLIQDRVHYLHFKVTETKERGILSLVIKLN